MLRAARPCEGTPGHEPIDGVGPGNFKLFYELFRSLSLEAVHPGPCPGDGGRSWDVLVLRLCLAGQLPELEPGIPFFCHNSAHRASFGFVLGDETKNLAVGLETSSSRTLAVVIC